MKENTITLLDRLFLDPKEGKYKLVNKICNTVKEMKKELGENSVEEIIDIVLSKFTESKEN
ncbi:MAG: hypothetical protein JW871_07730 [Endomicrobiales bacterium]|nr:hypothetical protein [Endomicrobiales bacterium]